MDPKVALLVALGVFTLGYLFVFVRAVMRDAAAGVQVRPTGLMSAVTFVTNLLDTWGIGSYATTTSLVRQFKLIPDEKIPGSLNVGYVLPTVLQAFIYTKLVPVGPTTLISMIGAAVVGAWLGAGVVGGWSRRKVQIGMGYALIGAATIMVYRIVTAPPTLAPVIELTGVNLILGIAGNFVLGALMTLGIGLYAPCLILVGLLGMDSGTATAFPIMMGSCAFLMPVACLRFVRANAYDPRVMLSMALPGIPAVLIGAFVLVVVPGNLLKWCIVAVVTYTAVSMLIAAQREKRSQQISSSATAAEAGVGA